MREDTDKAFHNIIDTFTGTDGGVRFCFFKIFIESLDKQAEKGDDASQQLVTMMLRFSKLIDIANERK